MSKHTPGPWTFVQGGSGDFPTWNVRIGTRGVMTLPSTASMETMDADARLIATAPKLLRELAWIRQFIHKDATGPGVVIRNASGEEIAVWLDRVDAAIAEAGAA